MIQIIGASKVAHNLQRYAIRMMENIDSAIWFVGENVKQRLQLKFPNINIQGDFHQSEHLCFTDRNCWSKI